MGVIQYMEGKAVNKEELREKIDSILVTAKERSSILCMKNDGIHIESDILDDLVALFQEPVELNREALVPILRYHSQNLIDPEEQINTIMAWAAGKKDCDHKGFLEWHELNVKNDVVAKKSFLDMSTLPGGCLKCKVKA